MTDEAGIFQIGTSHIAVPLWRYDEMARIFYLHESGLLVETEGSVEGVTDVSTPDEPTPSPPAPKPAMISDTVLGGVPGFRATNYAKEMQDKRKVVLEKVADNGAAQVEVKDDG